MASRGIPLTVRRMVEMKDENGNIISVPMEDLSEEQQEGVRQKISERLAAWCAREIQNDPEFGMQLLRDGLIRDPRPDEL